jgi:hypothetical protein
VTAENRTTRTRRAIQSGVVEVALLALVGCIFTAVALATRLLAGIDIT